MAKVKIEARTPQQMQQMVVELQMFLKEKGYNFVEMADHFAVTIPSYDIVEEGALEVPDKKKIITP